jgi:hypothetical protein
MAHAKVDPIRQDRSAQATGPIRARDTARRYTVVRSVRLQPDRTQVRLPPSRAKRASASLAGAFGGGGKADTYKKLP